MGSSLALARGAKSSTLAGSSSGSSAAPTHEAAPNIATRLRSAALRCMGITISPGNLFLQLRPARVQLLHARLSVLQVGVGLGQALGIRRRLLYFTMPRGQVALC